MSMNEEVQLRISERDLLSNLGNWIEALGCPSGEFEILLVAYCKWHNVPRSREIENLVEKVYSSFLMGEEELPAWARSYLRELDQKLSEEGSIEWTTDFGILVA